MKQRNCQKSIPPLVACIALLLLILRHVAPSWDIVNFILGGLRWLWVRVIFDITTGILVILVLCPWWFSYIRKFRNRPTDQKNDSQRSMWIKGVITAIAAVALLAHTVKPDITFDSISLALFALTLLPWLTSLVESAKFPGGLEVTFREVQRSGEKITGNKSEPMAGEAPMPSFVSVALEDPNLAMVGLRIEIEKRIRELAQRYKIGNQRSLSRLSNELRGMGVLQTEEMHGLQELIYAGNQAAHGAKVERKVADWAIDYGPVVLGALDRKIAEASDITTSISQ